MFLAGLCFCESWPHRDRQVKRVYAWLMDYSSPPPSALKCRSNTYPIIDRLYPMYQHSALPWAPSPRWIPTTSGSWPGPGASGARCPFIAGVALLKLSRTINSRTRTPAMPSCASVDARLSRRSRRIPKNTKKGRSECRRRTRSVISAPLPRSGPNSATTD